jgi:uncharacterized protein (DUF2342 family)
VPEEEAGFTACLLEEALARGMGHVDHLVAHAQIARRWSQFKDPDYVPGREDLDELRRAA